MRCCRRFQQHRSSATTRPRRLRQRHRRCRRPQLCRWQTSLACGGAPPCRARTAGNTSRGWRCPHAPVVAPWQVQSVTTGVVITALFSACCLSTLTFVSCQEQCPQMCKGACWPSLCPSRLPSVDPACNSRNCSSKLGFTQKPQKKHWSPPGCFFTMLGTPPASKYISTGSPFKL